MKLRERIADWVDPSRVDLIKRMKADYDSLDDIFDGALAHWEADRARLSLIAALETPDANATVRRMARIARGEE